MAEQNAQNQVIAQISYKNFVAYIEYKSSLNYNMNFANFLCNMYETKFYLINYLTIKLIN